MRSPLLLLLAASCLQAEIPPVSIFDTAVDNQGRIWIAGSLNSQLFTTTPGAFQPNYTAGACIAGFGFGPVPPSSFPCPDLFVMRLNPAGTAVEAATYFGGSGGEGLRSIEIGADGFVYLSGVGLSNDVPGLDVNMERFGAAFVAKFSPDLTRLEKISTFPGGLGGMAVAAGGAVFASSARCAATCDAEVTRVDDTGRTIIWRGSIGGQKLVLTPGDKHLWIVAQETAWKIDPKTGTELLRVTLPHTADFIVSTPESGLLITRGGLGARTGAYLTQVSPDGTIEANVRIGYNLGKIVLDGNGIAHIPGQGRYGIPITSRALARCADGSNDNFLLGWNTIAAEVEYATFTPFNGAPIVERNGDILLLHKAPDWLVTTITPSVFEEQSPCLTGPLLNWAAGVPYDPADDDANTVAPGEFVSVYGSGIGPAEPALIVMDGTRDSAPRSLAGVRLLFNGTPAAMIGASADVLIAQAPYNIAGLDKVEIHVERDGIPTNSIEMNVAPVMPAVISTQFGAVFNQDWTVNTESNPAKPGEVVALFFSGAGLLQGITDDAAAVAFPPPNLANEVRAWISGSGGQVVTFAGGVAEQLPGLVQVNIRVAPDFAYRGRQTFEVRFQGASAHAEFWVP